MRTLGLAFVLLVAAVPAEAEVGKACLTAPIGLMDFKPGHCFAANETEALWTARIEGVGGKPASTVFGKTLAGEPKTLRTCSDTQDLDVESLDALAVAVEPELQKIRRACDAVAYFGVGQPSEATHLRAPGLDLPDVSRVSVSVLPDGLSLPEGWNGGETLGEAEKAGKLKVVKAQGAALAFDYNGKRYAYSEAGRADFSGDGLEDMLVMVDEVLRNGERRHAYALGLTRLEADTLLVRIEHDSE